MHPTKIRSSTIAAKIVIHTDITQANIAYFCVIMYMQVGGTYGQVQKIPAIDSRKMYASVYIAESTSPKKVYVYS
jgi:hypothetical protein